MDVPAGERRSRRRTSSPRQRGSHVVMRRGPSVSVVPDHRELKTGTLFGVLKQAGGFRQEFPSALSGA